MALRSVACLNTSTAIAVGDSGLILRSIDRGGVWSKLSVEKVHGLKGISITDDGLISAVGLGGVLLQSVDGGDTWRNFTLTTTSLFGVTQRNDKVGTVVGDYGDILQTVDGGKSWVMQTSGTTNRLEDVAYKNDNEGIIVGDTTVWDGPGTILRTTDAGKNWLSVNNDFRGNLNAVCYLDEITTIAVGGYSVILRSTNAGLTWGSQSNAGEYDLQDVAFFDSITGMAVGHFGTIMKTFDGGVTWSRMGIGDRNHLTGVGFIDKDTWIVAGWIPYRGGITFRSEDAGQTWISSDTLPYSVMNLCASSDEQMIIGGVGGGMSVSSDSGKTWQAVASNTIDGIRAISKFGSGLGFAVGDRGTILRNIGNSDTNNPIVDTSSTPLLELFRPNPSNESTQIVFNVRMQGHVTIDIWDWTGKLVANITNENFVPGTYERTLNTLSLPSGTYTCRFYTGQGYESHNFIVMH